jgi:hypothetical protein
LTRNFAGSNLFYEELLSPILLILFILNRYSLRADTELLLQVPATRRSFGDRAFFTAGPTLYGIGCHNPSGLPITFHHSKASLKHIYFLNAIAILLMQSALE